MTMVHSAANTAASTEIVNDKSEQSFFAIKISGDK